MTTGKRLVVGIGIALLTALGAASTAHAQYGYPQPPRGVYRSGLTFGGSLGVGTISSSGCGPYCGGAGLIEGHIGGMVNPRLALMADLSAAVHSWDDGYFTGQTYSGIYAAAVQYWVTDIIWLKGGGGFARVQYGYDGTGISLDDRNGLAILVAAGIEVVQSFNFALDIQFRIGHAVYDNFPDVTNYAVMVGINWY